MTESAATCCFSFLHGNLHGGAVIAVVAVAFNDDRIQTLTQEDMFKGHLDGGGAGTG